MKPTILKQQYDLGDVCVVAVNAAEYAPDATGAADAAPAIQAAIDACAAVGGGTVYLPEGRYALRSYLDIKTAVTLRGEWINPEQEPNAGRGTILCCYCGREEPDGTPQITMRACSGLKGVALFYPEQTIANPVPYSPTVRQQGSDSITLENVTLVNPWRGVQCGPDGNELHTLKNVYITPVNIGFFMDVTTDIGRMQNLNIRPRYWEQFTLTPEAEPMDAAACEALRAHMLSNVTGVFMARSDWEYGYDIHVEHCHVGFTITCFASGGPNAQLSRLILHNCYIGFHLITVNAYGVALSDSRITADIPGLCAAVVSDNRFVTVMQLNGVELEGCYPHMVVHDGEGELSFVNCTLRGWTESAVLQKQGGLSMQQCSFGEGRHFELMDGIGGAQILGCDFAGGCQLTASEAARRELLFSEEALNLPVAPKGGHKFRMIPARPANAVLYNAADYGIVAGGKADNTAALQKALDDAGKTGGVVYLPAGWYRCDGSLYVPSGVELRGVFEVPSHTMGGGSVLQPTGGRGDENAEPFIVLAESAGVRGLVIQHPDQDPVEPVAYPWAVQGRGKNGYVIDVVFVNSWLGLDFASYPSEGHYVSYIGGAPIRCGLYIGSNSGEGWVENVQYNPHYWSRSNFENRPEHKAWRAFWHNQIKYLDALRFGYTENEHLLGTFVFAAKHGLQFVLQDGKGAKGTFIGHGTDGGEIGLHIEGVEDVDLINTELVSIESPQTRIYFLADEGATGRARVYNTLMWGNPHYAMVLGGADIQFEQINIVDPGETAITVNGGRQQFSGVYFYRNTGNVAVNGGEVSFVGGMTPRRAADRAACEPALDNRHTDGKFEERFSWSK